MSDRPFQFGVRPLPNGAEDSPEALAALLADCQAELAVVDGLSPLSLGEMAGQGGERIDRLKRQCWAEGGYSQAFIDRQSDLSTYLFRLRKRGKVDRALRRRQLGYLWQGFEQIAFQLRALDPVVWDGFEGEMGRPDTISDGLSQGIGVRQYL